MSRWIKDGVPQPTMVADLLVAGDWVSASPNGASCVELVALENGNVGLRDSKTPDGTAHVFTKAEIAAFIDGAKCGVFDHLVI